MALTTVAAVKTHLGINDTSEDTFLNQLEPAVEAAFNALIDRQLPQQSYTDFYGGNNRPILALNEYPVLQPTQTGTLTSGSAVVTGLTDTSYLGVGLTVTDAAGNVPAGTTILSVDSGTQVTLSASVTGSATETLTFRPTVLEDPYGYYGSVSGSFGVTTVLTSGIDYALVLDGRSGSADVGRLYKINGVWGGRWESKRGLLAAASRPGVGNYKVTYTAGYAAIPQEVQLCIWEVCAQLRAARKRGRAIGSEGYEGYSYSLEGQAMEWMQVGSVGQLVSYYKRRTPRYKLLTL